MEYEISCSIFFVLCGDRTLPPLPPKKPDSPPTPLQERGVVTTGKRGLSVIEMTEHPLSPPGTGVSTTQWGGGG